MDSRQRLIETTARLLWRQGLRATGLNQILAESHTPRGSLYFHFPGGKEQLAAEAIRAAGAVMTANIREALEHRDIATALTRFVASYAKEMRDSDFHHGSPIATVALEASATSEAIREVCAAVFGEWLLLLEQRLQRDGMPAEVAKQAAAVILAGVEGSSILCRTLRSTEPLEQAGAHLVAAFGGRKVAQPSL